MQQRAARAGVQIDRGGLGQLDEANRGAAEKRGAEGNPELLQMPFQADMVHYLDVMSGAGGEVKESAELKEGFGFFVQHLLSGGMEKAHAEGRGGAGGEAAEKVHGEGKGMGGAEEKVGGKTHGEGKGGCDGKDDGRHGEEDAGSKVEIERVAGKCGRGRKEVKWRDTLKGPVWENYVDGMAWILEHGGGEGREFRCSHCSGDDSSSSSSSSTHLSLLSLSLSLLVRFDAIPRPLEGSGIPLEWEEWPGGEEAAVKFLVNRKERCFGLGIVEERGEPAEKLTQIPPQHTSEAGRGGRHAKEKGSNPEGQGDVDFLVGFAGYIMDPPACTQCSTCSREYIQSVCIAALIANFAYRPVRHLFSRVLSVFPPSSPGFGELVECFDFPARLPLNLHMLLRRAEQVPLYFLIRMAVLYAHPLLVTDEFKKGYSGRWKEENSKVQGLWDREAD
ncbi:unnamed protein product [Closterium sp. Naga37s-1]|nr:unnamed protein product [Closterium sp. Naga37s-1]